ncbi:MAG: hypothetical protein PHE27_01470 [Alphaproteobacteria bacterium]|nr:hypothetical protein [Alphaproteobacteria bacterium]
MHKVSKTGLFVAASVFAFSLGASVPAHADDSETLQALQMQINELQKQLAKLQAAQAKSEQAAAAREEAPVRDSGAVADSGSLKGVIKAKTGVDLTLGGYLDATTIYRSKMENADVGSNFNTMMPFDNARNAHQSEFRESARSSRLSLRAAGNPDADTKLTGYVEVDFQAAGTTSTPTQTNSYVPRMRHAFAQYENDDWGLHVLAGQTWSLATMHKSGINAFAEDIPMVVDSAYLPGFNFTRNTQLRIVKDFGKKFWIGLSAESPQAITSGICTSSSNPSNSPSTSASACDGFGSTIFVNGTPYTGSFSGNVTSDVAPDVIVKMAYDPGWGHYEAFGAMRFFHDTVGTNVHNNYYIGGGGGLGAVLPVVPKYVDVRANVMYGKGMGRYSAAQLPDFSITPTGSLKPIEEYTAMLGVVAHPTPVLDTFLFAGLEQAFRNSVAGQTNNAYGYGNFDALNGGCNVIGGTCYAQTSSVWQITPGLWYRFYEGEYGKMRFGAQYSWTRRNAFSDRNGINPHSIENVAMFSLRYSPF